MNQLTEDQVVEQKFIDYCLEQGRKQLHAVDDTRDSNDEVVYVDKLLAVLQSWEEIQHIPDEYLQEAIDALTTDRSTKTPYQANKEVYNLLKHGYQVEYEDDDGEMQTGSISFIDWENPENNTFHVQQQFTVSGEVYDKRPDIVCFVNGIPFVVIECKNADQPLKKAYDDNIKDYLEAVPQLFWYNQLIMITNGVHTKIGAFTSGYEHYYTWKKAKNEEQDPSTTMKRAIGGVLNHDKLLDIVEHFVLFDEQFPAKIVAKNHQYLGVNNVFERFLKRGELDGKLGVYRHTQGSGKSYSMMFVVEKILREVPGNFTFVIVTDRKELDTQIAEGFANCGIVQDDSGKAESINDLKKLLQQDKRVIFTLIHKFDDSFDNINERDDIIVMTDEAHRSQYGELAMWMRRALPNANFLGFTGTPLMSEDEELTKQEFGDYVSVYNFSQSIEDGATVPIYYENCTPKVLVDNPDLAEQVKALQGKFSNEDDDEKTFVEGQGLSLAYAVLKRDDYLNEVSEHIAQHFHSRGSGSNGKAMVVCVDKKVAVRMYWKTKKAFEELKKNGDEDVYVPEMGVMISLGDKQEEDRRMKDTGGDFDVLRKKIKEKDGNGKPLMETHFKDADHPLEIVFVCSMWLTGFDAQCCTTLYLQKPMRNHTLMQTIARVNRVYEGKTNGTIVDYVNIFADLEKALEVYASPELGEPSSIIKNKEDLTEDVEERLENIKQFLHEYEIDLSDIFAKKDEIVEVIDPLLASEHDYKEFFRLFKELDKSYQSLLPNPKAGNYAEDLKKLQYLVASVQESLGEDVEETGISREQALEELNEILDKSVRVEEYSVKENFRVTDLTNIDYEKLRGEFKKKEKNAIIQQLKRQAKKETEEMVQVNPQRRTFMEKLEKLIERHNKGSLEAEKFFELLVQYTKSLTQEQKRAAKEKMTEGELAVFDTLFKDNLTEREESEVKRIAKQLLDKVREVIKGSARWRDQESVKGEIKNKIRDFLYEKLPESYDEVFIDQKRDELYKYIYQHRELIG